jgi:hypothetical protein
METIMNQSNAQRADNQNEEASVLPRRPVDSVRHGNVEIAIWKNPSAKGDFFSASAPSIRYKDEADQWKDGSSFGRHDLLDLAEASREAALRIRDLQKARGQGASR